jgi:hypothetical protein
MESSSGQVDFAAVQRRKTTDYLAVVAEARQGHAAPKGLFLSLFVCLPHFSVRDLLLALMKLRGSVVAVLDFWEVVVVTAADQDQKRFYECQLEERQKQGSIPAHVKCVYLAHYAPHRTLARSQQRARTRYLVIEDPPGDKIGCGGSTMHVLRLLDELYGPQLYERTAILARLLDWMIKL